MYTGDTAMCTVGLLSLRARRLGELVGRQGERPRPAAHRREPCQREACRRPATCVAEGGILVGRRGFQTMPRPIGTRPRRTTRRAPSTRGGSSLHRVFALDEIGHPEHRQHPVRTRSPGMERRIFRAIGFLPGLVERIRLLRYQGLEQRPREGAAANGTLQHGTGLSPVSIDDGTPRWRRPLGSIHWSQHAACLGGDATAGKGWPSKGFVHTCTARRLCV